MKFTTKPNDLVHDSRNSQLNKGHTVTSGGLTKREYFSVLLYTSTKMFSIEQAVEAADQLIKELNK